jgi:hypothetical protein
VTPAATEGLSVTPPNTRSGWYFPGRPGVDIDILRLVLAKLRQAGCPGPFTG